MSPTFVCSVKLHLSVHFGSIEHAHRNITCILSCHTSLPFLICRCSNDPSLMKLSGMELKPDKSQIAVKENSEMNLKELEELKPRKLSLQKAMASTTPPIALDIHVNM